MILPDTHAPTAKAFLFLAGTLVVALYWGTDAVAVTILLTATLKDHSRQQTRIHCDSRRMAEEYFNAMGLPEAKAWWHCFHPGPAPLPRS